MYHKVAAEDGEQRRPRRCVVEWMDVNKALISVLTVQQTQEEAEEPVPINGGRQISRKSIKYPGAI